jgi:hypothetical protein
MDARELVNYAIVKEQRDRLLTLVVRYAMHDKGCPRARVAGARFSGVDKARPFKHCPCECGLDEAIRAAYVPEGK